MLFISVSLVALSSAGDVVTYHNDIARTGLNSQETILTHSNVNSAGFGLLFSVGVDGVVNGEPLYLSSVSIPSHGTHNVLYAVTENDSVYAFDADVGTLLWQVSVLGSGETPSDNRNCHKFNPEIGITSTPVIDRGSGPNGTIYVVAMSKNSSGTYFQRIHALDVTTGSEEFGGPTTIQAMYPGTGDNSQNGNVIFDPAQYTEREGLLLLNGVVYTGWTSHCDDRPYTGWVIGYGESTLAQTSVLNLTPNGSEGAIWQSGGGIASDGSNLFLLTANGTFDTVLNGNNGFPILGDYGNAFVKISPVNNLLTVTDYFAMHNTVAESDQDQDFGSSGALVLPPMQDSSGVTHSLAIGAGKDTNIYIVDRTNMGKFNASTDSAIYQKVRQALVGGNWSVPAYYNGNVYFGPVGNNLLEFRFTNAKLLTSPVAKSSTAFTYPGTTPSISSNGSGSGIVWAIEHSDPNDVLHAYAAGNISIELYNSAQVAGRDQFGQASHFGTPMIANGKVYVGTTNGVAVFGLLGMASILPNKPHAGATANSPTNPGTSRSLLFH